MKNHVFADITTSYKLELLPQNDPNTVKSNYSRITINSYMYIITQFFRISLGNYPSVYKILDYCTTSLGKRTLRARILEPMCDITSITDIHDCIDELNQPENCQLKEDFKMVLTSFNNVDRLYKLAIVVPQDINFRAAEILMYVFMFI